VLAYQAGGSCCVKRCICGSSRVMCIECTLPVMQQVEHYCVLHIAACTCPHTWVRGPLPLSSAADCADEW
jgi:hypothetical protein